MLRELAIRNFAVIDDLQIRFSEGLTILTGETGAGKSIIVNAVNLLLGARATADQIRTGAEAAELEAVFEIPETGETARALAEGGYDAEGELIVRRIISRTERHRVYVNGKNATMRFLAEITRPLAGISGQHENQILLQEDRHLLLLDRYGDLMSLREETTKRYREMKPLIKRFHDLLEQKDQIQAQREALEFEKQEIEAVSPQAGEESAIEEELQRRKHAETLFKTVHETAEILYGAENAVIGRLDEAAKALAKAAQLDPDLSPFAEGTTETMFRIEDIGRELNSYLGNLESDEGRLETLESRLHAIRRLTRKYGGNIDSVNAHLSVVRRRLAESETLDDDIQEIRQAIQTAHQTLAESVRHLSEKRKRAAKTLSQRVEEELASLNMPATRFRVEISHPAATEGTEPYLSVDGTAISETGVDKVRFRIAPNVGEDLKPLASVASGGELSRVILALKAILADAEAVGCVIFDEVDAGIGGETAEVVGRKLDALARYHQILCITHSPQIAKFGTQHFRIVKEMDAAQTRTRIFVLSPEERVHELARMLGGVTITAATLDHAREMLTGAVAPAAEADRM